MNDVIEQLVMALLDLARAIERVSGPKAVVHDEFGNVIGIEPVE